MFLSAKSLLFTPCPATRCAMHRIYANRINSRDMSRVFCDLRSQKTPRGILPVNSNVKSPYHIDPQLQLNLPVIRKIFSKKNGTFLSFLHSEKPFLIPAAYSRPYFFEAKNISFTVNPSTRKGRFSKIWSNGIFYKAYKHYFWKNI